MGRFTINGDEGLAAFKERYVPEGCTAKLPEANELPTYLPREGEIGLYPVFFMQAELRLPLDRLLCDVLRRCNLAPCQLNPNGIKVILGCSALNKLLGVNLTLREIFYCYMLCQCPKDKSRYYFRARPKTPELVKSLTKSETGFYEGMVIIGGAWGDGDIAQIKRYVQSHVAKIKRPGEASVDFDSINPVLNYNGSGRITSLNHPRAIHTLLGYTPIDTNFLLERENQSDWLGPSKRPKKLKDRQKVKKKTPPRHVVHTGIIIREGLVTSTGQFAAELGGSSAVPEGRGKRPVLEQSQSSSDTRTDSELEGLHQKIEGATYQDLEYTAAMAPKRRVVTQLLANEMAAGGAGSSGPSARAPVAASRKRVRYTYPIVETPSSSPAADSVFVIYVARAFQPYVDRIIWM